MKYIYRNLVFACLFVSVFTCFAAAQPFRQITDANLREIKLPQKIDRIICSGPGCLRLITYFNAQNLVVAVDNIEIRENKFDARPYSLANPQFKKLPVFGGFRGHDDPEKILGLANLPQVIFKTYATMGYDPVELEQKTGIPVVILEYGDLSLGRKKFFNTLNIIGQVLQKKDRAKELITFFEDHINELEKRTRNIDEKKTCFIGGIAFKGPHGFQSTEPSYPPFQFVNADNIAATSGMSEKNFRHSNFSREKILLADPDTLFVDLSTLQMGEKHGGLHELKNDPIFQGLTAIKANRVYGVLPYNWYTQNFGSILADAWYIGKILYPDRFSRIDPEKKADDIYKFLVAKPVFTSMNSLFKNMVFQPIDLN
ncbi:MAG: iron ABC transporter substrate-binding protein [Thermodesulfobacteriota bacterium]